MAQRDTNTNPAPPVDNAFAEQEELPMPRTPAPAGDDQRARGKAQHPDAGDESDLATTPPSDHVEPGTKPERNTM